MPIVDVNGVDIWYELIGEGEPMMLHGGSGLGKENFDPVIDPLKSHYELLRYDMRGYGKSGRDGVITATIGGWADDAIALMDAIGWTSAHHHGTSLGGNVALECGLRYPDRCTSMVLHGFMAKADVAHSLLFKACEEHSRLAGEMDWTVAALITEAFADHDFIEQNPTVCEDAVLPRLKLMDVETWLVAFRAMREANQVEGLTECQVPALVITGERARHLLDLAPSGVGLRKLASLLPRAQLVLLAGAGHLVIFERTDQYVAEISSFTRSLGVK